MARYPMRREAGQSIDEMAEQLEASSAGNRLNSYPEQSAAVRKQALRQVIDQQRDLLRKSKERGRRINLDSLDEVSQTADVYLESCAQAGIIPSMLGFAAATGWSRPTIYNYIARSNTESAKFLDGLRSSWAAIMSQMALARQASEPTAIFLLKNSGQDLTDRCELTAIPAVQRDHNDMSREELEAWFLDGKNEGDNNVD